MDQAARLAPLIIGILRVHSPENADDQGMVWLVGDLEVAEGGR
jgi:hypothetical protein